MKVKLRSFDYKTDLERLFLYMTKEENQTLFSHSFQIHNLAMFEGWITEKFSKNIYHDFFMIENSRGQTVGFTFSYDFFIYDCHCKYSLCLYEEFQSMGLGVYAAVKMMDYLFSKYPLKRIFISVFDYNKNSLSCNLKGGFEEVGILPEYRFSKGRYFSMHILTISRESFYQRYNRTLMKIKS